MNQNLVMWVNGSLVSEDYVSIVIFLKFIEMNKLKKLL